MAATDGVAGLLIGDCHRANLEEPCYRRDDAKPAANWHRVPVELARAYVPPAHLRPIGRVHCQVSAQRWALVWSERLVQVDGSHSRETRYDNPYSDCHARSRFHRLLPLAS